MSSEMSSEKTVWEKIKGDPVPAIGMAGFFSVIGYSLFNYKRKGTTMKPSVYVIQTRVAAQGLVISLLTLSLGYHMIQRYYHRNDPVEVQEIKPEPQQTQHFAHLSNTHHSKKH